MVFDVVVFDVAVFDVVVVVFDVVVVVFDVIDYCSLITCIYIYIYMISVVFDIVVLFVISCL